MTAPGVHHGARGLALVVGLAVAACGASHSLRPQTSERTIALAPDLLPLPAGRTPAYRLAARGASVARRRQVAGLSCRRRSTRGDGVHLELYARRRVVPLPAGIGVAPPLQRSGAYVRGGVCVYPLRTYEPTGLVVIDRQRSALRLADLFAVWGQPLSSDTLARFHGSVRAYVGGRRWSGRPGQIPLRPHAEIVLEVGALVAPHPRYLFPPGR